MLRNATLTPHSETPHATPAVSRAASLRNRTLARRKADPASPVVDPMRAYLREIGHYPLLSHQQEIALARNVEANRRRFRRELLECDFVLREAVAALNRVHEGELPFDRVIQLSVSDRLERHQILGRLPHNLRTLGVILEHNRSDFQIVVSRSQTTSERQAVWRRLVRRRRRAVRLVEELGLRMELLEPLFHKLANYNDRLQPLRPEMIREGETNVHLPNRGTERQHYHRILRLGADVDPATIDANYKDGLLRITAARTEATRPKRIEVHT